jgi:hypothetical protein
MRKHPRVVAKPVIRAAAIAEWGRKPTAYNAFFDAFNGRFWAECLSAHSFATVMTLDQKGGLSQILQRGAPARRH